MLIENLTTEQLALHITHYVYRDTNIIENSHSSSATMDEDFYKAVHKVVARNITYTKKFFKLVLTCNNQTELMQESNKFDPTTGFAFVHFIGSLTSKVGTGWDKPVSLENVPKSNLASFILDGRFKENCDKNVVLTNNVMKEINKDVYNRVYTLFKNKTL